MPSWLRLLPPFFSHNGRSIWWSLRAPPVHGWHVQQILKIAAALQLSEQRFCIVNSDNVFFRAFDAGAYAGGEKTPLYVDPGAISAKLPLHTRWLRNCDQLLGRSDARFPADDYVGNVIVWDKSSVKAMSLAIETACRRSWPEALCRTRPFSEYLLYGCFVRSSAAHASAHEVTTRSLACAYWDDAPLSAATLAAMVRSAPDANVALCIHSFSSTLVSTIREAVGLTPEVANARPLAKRA